MYPCAAAGCVCAGVDSILILELLHRQKLRGSVPPAATAADLASVARSADSATITSSRPLDTSTLYVGRLPAIAY